MPEKTENKKVGKRRRWPWIALVVILALIAVIRLAMRADFVFDYIRGQAEQIANENLNGFVTIQNMSGDLWNHVEIRGIDLTQGDDRDPLATVDSIKVRYSILSLLSSPFVVSDVDIFGLNSYLTQDQDSVWNFERVLPEQQPEADGEADPFPLRIVRAEIHQSNIYVNAPFTLPDTSIQLREINLLAALELFEQGFSFDLDNLAFNLHEGRFREPVRFETAASGDSTAVQLDRLMIAGGASMLEMMGSYNLEREEFEVSALLDPLSWRAIRAYAEDAPLSRDVTLRLNAEGNMENLLIRLNANAEGLEQLTIAAKLAFTSNPVLTSLSIHARNMDAAILLDDPEMPAFAELESSFEGTVPFDDYRHANLDGFLRISGLLMEPYEMDRVAVNFALRENVVFTNLELNRADGMVFTEAHVTDIWSDFPQWTVDYRINRVNPALWAANEELAGMINASGSLEGRGFELGRDPVRFRLNLHESILQDQRVESALITGTINDELLTVDTEIQTRQNLITLNGDAAWAAEEPAYRFNLAAADFDLSEFMMNDTLTTRLNLNVSGEGRGFAPETMELAAAVRIDSSWVNNELIDALTMDMNIRDSILVMDEVNIRSRIVEGELYARQNLIRMEDPDNELEFYFRLLDLQVLSELAGADIFNVQGSLSGNMRPDQFQRLALNVDLNLHDLVYDTLAIERIEGRITTTVEENPEYDFDFVINGPQYGDLKIEDVRLQSAGSYINEILSGSYNLGLIAEEATGLRQRADYRFTGDSLHVTTHELDLISEEGNYILQNSFGFAYVNELIRIDTLMLRGDRTGATIQMALNQYSPEGFAGHFEGDHVNLGVLQEILFQHRQIEGILTSQVDFNIRPDQMIVNSQTLIRDFTYDALELDTVQLALNLSDRRLQSNFAIRKDLQTLLVSEFNVPFELADPEVLDEEFFQQPVHGFVEIAPLDLEMFSAVIEDLGYEASTGTITLNSTLRGTAGEPDFEGEFVLANALLSDIPVRELSLKWDYNHDAANLTLSSYLDTDTQRAFDLDGFIPFRVDFRTLEVSAPLEDDEMMLTFRSNDLNLAAFSDFINPETARGLRGKLNADISLHGTMGDLAMEGFFRITEGQFRAVPNEITFRNISIDAGLEPGKIVLNRASVQSAGRLTGSGEIIFDGLTPGDFNLRFSAQNFRVYATRDIDAYIGMDTRLLGNLDAPNITGNLRVERGTIFLDDFGDPEIEEVVLEEELEDTDLLADPESGFYENLVMELTFTVDRNFFLRSRREPEINLALAGNLDLVKLTGQDVEIFGDVTIPSGFATTFGKRFDIDSGTIVFSGDPANPQMDIRTIYRPRQQGGTQIEIYYTISGTVEEPEFAYSSEPEMEFQDIVSYTLFGRPFNALASWEQGAAGRSETDIVSELAMEVLLDRVETLAAERLGIDVIEIDNTRRGPGSGTSIKAGKFLTDRVFVAFLQELGGTDAGRQVILEYMIRRNLDLVITGSDDHRSGVDVLWRLDY